MTTDQDELAVRKRARADVAQRAYLLIALAVAAASMVFTAVISAQNGATLSVINDCTQTGGKCHDRGLQQTAQAVGSITQRDAANAACQIVLSRQSPRSSARELYARINKCANETVTALNHHQP